LARFCLRETLNRFLGKRILANDQDRLKTTGEGIEY
jgi:hypothetical protein